MTVPSNRPAASPAESSATGDEARAGALDLSFTKIVGGAAAAVTTAVAASFLGVSGTITGAAFGSIVSSIAAALYAHSLKSAGTRIRTTATVVRRTGQRTDADPQDPATVPPELTGRSAPLPGETVVVASTETGPAEGRVSPQAAAARPRQRDRSRGWKPVAVLAGFIFVVALGAISVTELFLGHPISNSQSTGTSVGAAVGRAPVETEPSDEPSESPSPSDSASPSDSTESPSPSDSGSLAPGETTESGEPDGSPQPTDQEGQREGDPAPSEPAAPTQSPAAESPAAQGAVTSDPVA